MRNQLAIILTWILATSPALAQWNSVTTLKHKAAVQLTIDNQCAPTMATAATFQSCGPFTVSASATQMVVVVRGSSSSYPVISNGVVVGTGTCSASLSGMTGAVATHKMTEYQSGGSAEIWTLSSATSGWTTGSSVVICASWGTHAYGNGVGGISLLGGTGSFQSGNGTTGSSSPTSSGAVTSATNHIVIDAISQNSANCGSSTMTATGSGQSFIAGFPACTNSDGRLGSSYINGASSVTFAYTLTSATGWAEVWVDAF
jgi:hypothetical protein